MEKPKNKTLINLSTKTFIEVVILLFVLMMALDTKIRYRKDVEKFIDIPILGEIPTKAKDDERHIVVEDKKRDQISEVKRNRQMTRSWALSMRFP